MTVAIAWVRRLTNRCEELLFCSDSRLSGGARIDCVPKMISLPRADCAVCFAGDTYYAYPLMIQLANAIQAYFPSRSRGMDLHDLKGHILKVFNNMIDSVHDYADGMEIPQTTFVFGGYSWIQKSFDVWSINYHEKERKFIAENRQSFLGFGKIVFAGDRGNEAKIKLIQLLKGRYDLNPCNTGKAGFDMEPFEVIRDMLREANNLGSIGGPPQVVKVYQHMNALPFGVYWPNRESGNISVMGRQFLNYEKSDVWVLDPDTLETVSVLKNGPTE